MTHPILVIYFVYAICFQHVWAKSKFQTIVQLDSYGNCPGEETVNAHYNESGVEPFGKTSAGFGTLIVDYTMPRLEKGSYKINQATVDVRKLALIKFPTDGYWRVKIEADDEMRRIYCMMFGGKFIKVRA